MKGEAAAALWEFDRELGVPLCGLDEAGRGPLAGPVFAACVILKPGAEIPGLNDSKKLTEKRREAIFEEILGGGLAWFGIGSASPEEIDRINILQATFLAMNRAFDQMLAGEGVPEEFLPQLALVDGNRDPGLPIETRTVVKGDGRSAAIAAASVLAKVSRDRWMLELDALYPQYQLAKHKGYPTRLHYELITKHGISPIHRRSFLKNLAKHQKPETEETAAQRAGKAGEDYTAGWLTRQGYEILDRNWHCPWGEVDLIARKGETAAFVEVKARRPGAMVSPLEAVDRRKQQRLIKTAQAWLAQNGGDLQPRMDVAAVTVTEEEGRQLISGFDYYEGAFEKE